jgi:putative peptide zinc metalloprotease protein
MSSTMSEGNDDFPLPVLREDLSILNGPIATNGEPTWNIYDPIRNKYFRIGWIAFHLLSRWSAGRAETLLNRVRNETTCNLSLADIQDFIKFLYGNSLTRESMSGESSDYLDQFNATKMHWFLWLLKNYLFIRIPLVRPNKFVQKSLPLVEALFTKTFRTIVIGCGLLGVFLVLREWEEFTSTFLYFFNVNGAIYYGLALVMIKIFHELGHAYVAARYGCKVPTMGVALLVMFPMLYTDTTDSWRLVSRQQRMFIGAAGMITEIYIALIATFLWSFLPEGVFKSIAFIFATTSWTLSIIVNTNILMRFDGYYILSDWWGIENLQARGFAMGKWRLREVLFNLKLPKPEILPDPMIWRLTLYAWSVWVYRLFLFIGIAVLVYFYFFKLLGLLLFAIEILWFFLKPVHSEFLVWWELRGKIINSNRFPYLLSATIIFLLILLIPFSTTVSIPGIMKTSNITSVYSLIPGRIISLNINQGALVKKDEVLVVMESPFLDKEIENATKELQVLNFRLNRRVSDPEELAGTNVLIEQRQELQSRIDGLLDRQSQLAIRAPIDGKLVDITRNLHPGRWINEDLMLLSIIDPLTLELTGIVTAKDLGRIDINQDAVFLPNEPELDEVKAQVIEIGKTNVRNIEALYFTSTYGGTIAVRKEDSGKLIPEDSSYRVKLLPSETTYELDKVSSGRIFISGRPLSLVKYAYESVASVLIRESGF